MIQQFNVFCVHDSDIWACGEPNEVTPEPQGIDSATEEEISSPPAPAHAPVQQAEEYMMEGPRMSPPMNGYAMHGPPPPGSGYGNGHMNGSSPPPPGPGYGPMHPPPPGSGYSPMNGPPQNGFGYGPGNGMSPGGPGFSPVMNSSGYNGPGMGQDWQADMVIGVDFGMTCTGKSCFVRTICLGYELMRDVIKLSLGQWDPNGQIRRRYSDGLGRWDMSCATK